MRLSVFCLEVMIISLQTMYMWKHPRTPERAGVFFIGTTVKNK